MRTQTDRMSSASLVKNGGGTVTVQGSVHVRFRELIPIPLYTKEYLWVHGSRDKIRTIILETSGTNGKYEQNSTKTHNKHTHTKTKHTHTKITTLKQCETHMRKNRMFSYTHRHTLRPVSGQTHTLSKNNKHTPLTPCHKHNNQKKINHAENTTTDIHYTYKPRHTNIVHNTHTKNPNIPLIRLLLIITLASILIYSPKLFSILLKFSSNATDTIKRRKPFPQHTIPTTPHLLGCGEKTPTTSSHSTLHKRLEKKNHTIVVSRRKEQEKKTETPVQRQKRCSEHRKKGPKTKNHKYQPAKKHILLLHN